MSEPRLVAIGLDELLATPIDYHKAYDELREAARKVRRLQEQYFKARTKDLLVMAKMAERDLDRLLK